jgi:CRP-like cAMP-binding protein
METNSLLYTLNNVTILSESLRERIKLYLVEDHCKKKSILLKAGQVSQRIYFIKEGFARAYYFKGNDEFTSWFMTKGDIIVSVYSFFSRNPSFENIEVLEDSVLQSINWDQLQNIYKDFPKLISEYPEILQKASLGQIASFLSIKQETLSRIRSKK